MQISFDGRVKNQLGPGQESMGDAPMLSLFFSGKKSLIKTDRCGGTLL
jgi:hypothetical protein